MKGLSREAILSANDLKKEKVECPEWGGFVFVKSLTAKERDEWETSLFDTKRRGKNVEVKMKRENIRARFVALTVIDESGTLLFSVADIAELGNKNASAMDRIFEVAQKLSGLTEEDLDELEKNLKDTQADISSTK